MCEPPVEPRRPTPPVERYVHGRPPRRARVGKTSILLRFVRAGPSDKVRAGRAARSFAIWAVRTPRALAFAPLPARARATASAEGQCQPRLGRYPALSSVIDRPERRILPRSPYGRAGQRVARRAGPIVIATRTARSLCTPGSATTSRSPRCTRLGARTTVHRRERIVHHRVSRQQVRPREEPRRRRRKRRGGERARARERRAQRERARARRGGGRSGPGVRGGVATGGARAFGPHRAAPNPLSCKSRRRAPSELRGDGRRDAHLHVR